MLLFRVLVFVLLATNLDIVFVIVLVSVLVAIDADGVTYN